MLRTLLFLTTFSILAAAQPGGSTAAEPTPSEPDGAEIPLRLADTVIPVRASLDLTLTPEADTFPGRIEIDVEVRKATRQVWLNARDLEIVRAVVTQDDRDSEAEADTRGTDFLLLTLAEPLEPGPARITVDYRADVERVDTVGVFGQEHDGEHYLFSQFEAIDARRALPGFDEPRFKHPWRVTLRVPEGDLAFFNTPITEESVVEGTRVVRFAETPPLPTYLLAVAVGPFDVVDVGKSTRSEVPMRLLVPKGDGSDTAYAASTVDEVLGWMEEYFGISHPYRKLDQVAIPHTVGFGAMEHPGLVTYARSIMIVPEDEMSLSRKMRWDLVLAHELGHQWFGNYVTLAWWDDIWLNEGFANWIEGKTMSALRPEWGTALERIEGRNRAMSLDSLTSARRVRQPIAGNDDIANAFDSITYSKGAALLSMFEAWLGEDRFRDAIRHYLEAHAHGTATSDDFLAALATTGEKAAPESFADFLDQAGVPMLSVALDCPQEGDPMLRLRQERFLPTGSEGSRDRTWLLPVCARYPGGADETGTAVTCGLLRGAEGSIPLPEAGACPAWVLANADEAGYYRTAYEGDLLNALLAEDGARLSEPELLGVLGDTLALTDAGRAPLDRALTAVLPFADHPRHQVADLVLDLVAALDDHLVPPDLDDEYAAVVREAFGPRAKRLGFSPSPADDPDDQILRPSLLGVVGDEGEDPEIAATAVTLAKAWLEDRGAVAPELTSTILALAAQNGDTELFDRYLAAARATDDDTDRERLLHSLGHFPDPKLRARALGLVLDDTFDIRSSRGILWRAASEPAGREQVWEFIQASWEELLERLPRQSRASLPYYARGFCSLEKAREIEAFFTPRIEGLEGAPRNLAQAVETIELCAAYAGAQREAVERWLEGSTNGSR